jgi:hypothetical protein
LRSQQFSGNNVDVTVDGELVIGAGTYVHSYQSSWNTLYKVLASQCGTLVRQGFRALSALCVHSCYHETTACLLYVAQTNAAHSSRSFLAFERALPSAYPFASTVCKLYAAAAPFRAHAKLTCSRVEAAIQQFQRALPPALAPDN